LFLVVVLRHWYFTR